MPGKEVSSWNTQTSRAIFFASRIHRPGEEGVMVRTQRMGRGSQGRFTPEWGSEGWIGVLWVDRDEEAIPGETVGVKVLCESYTMTVFAPISYQYHVMKRSIWFMHPGWEALSCHASATLSPTVRFISIVPLLEWCDFWYIPSVPPGRQVMLDG